MSARILVVDDVDANVKILEAKLRASFYDVLIARDGIEALEVAQAEKPDLVLLDVMMPRMDGFECCRRLKADPATADIPVAMVTALDQPSDKLRGLEAGADDFLTKPPNDTALSARVRNLVRTKMALDELRSRDTFQDVAGRTLADVRPEGRVVIIESRAASGRAMADGLSAALPVICATTASREAALAAAHRDAPDLFVISNRLSGDDGLRLCTELRSRPDTREAAIVAIVEDGDFAMAASSLDLGANDYIMRPVDTHELIARARTQLLRKNYADLLRLNAEQGMMMAITDGLTGLHNRRYADQQLARELGRATENAAPLSVMLLDLDRFKSINDTYGHGAGDAVLVEFAKRLQRSVRGVDAVARFGGEEFLVLAPETDADECLVVAERLRQSVAERAFQITEDITIDVTVSVGVARSLPGESPSDVLRRADAALYASKAGGRNRVTLSEEAGAAVA